MKKFILKTTLFLAILICMLSVLDFVVTEGLRKTEDAEFNVWNEIINGKTESDLIINGSSRAWLHISPEILENELGMSVYNLGLDGFHFYMQDARYQLHLKYNDPPKVVIQTLSIFSLQKREGLYQAEQFFPYMNELDLTSAMKSYEGLNVLDYYIPFLRYVRSREVMVKGINEFFDQTHYTNVKYNGYMGQYLMWDGSFDSFATQYKDGIVQEIDQQSVDLFETYIQECLDAGTILVLVYPPEYYEVQGLYTNRNEIMKLYQDLAEKYQILFLDYSDHEICYEKEYFYNSQHLNHVGAEKFSKILASDLKDNLIKD